MLQTNLVLNGPLPVRPILAAISAFPGNRPMLIFKGEMTGCRFPAPGLDFGHGTKENLIVSCRTLEEVLSETGQKKVDFLKMDCECCEFEILPHLDKSIFQSLRVFAMEYHDNVGISSAGKLARMLSKKKDSRLKSGQKRAIWAMYMPGARISFVCFHQKIWEI